MNKEKLRAEYIRKFREFDQDTSVKEKALSDLGEKINIFFRHRAISKIMAYRPLKTEIPVLGLLKDMKCEIFIPEIRGNYLVPVSIRSGLVQEIEQMDFIVVPGLFITREGLRLGRGGGYYDRLLVSYPQNRTLFVGFDWQIRDELPEDPWDKKIGFWICPGSDGECLIK